MTFHLLNVLTDRLLALDPHVEADLRAAERLVTVICYLWRRYDRECLLRRAA